MKSQETIAGDVSSRPRAQDAAEPARPAPESESSRTLRSRRLALAILLLIAVAALFLHPHPEDFGDYATFGNLVLSHGNLYGAIANTGTPFFFLFCVPLAIFYDAAPRLALLSWSVLNDAALVVAIALAARMIYGRRLTLGARQRAESGPKSARQRAESGATPARQCTGPSGKPRISLGSPEILIPLFLLLPYLIDHLEFHQINLIILALAFGGLFWQQNGRPIAGGISLGAAVAIKVMPLIFIPYLAYRRRWAAAFSSAIAATLFTLSPSLVFGWSGLWNDLFVWWHKNAVGGGAWAASAPNQSIFALWDRVIGHRLVPFVDTAPNALPFTGDPRVNLAWLLTLVGVGVATALAFRVGSRGAAFGFFGGSLQTSPRGELLEWSVLFLIAAIFAPVTWKHYLVVMILPNMLLYAVWRSPNYDAGTRRLSGAALLVCSVMGFFTGYGLAGRALALRLEAGSIVTLAVLLMLGALLWLRRRACFSETISPS